MKLTIEKINDFKVYTAHFDDLTDLYYYLKSNPPVNEEIFSRQASIIEGESFAGDSLDRSIEYIVDGYPYKFKNFLDASERMQNAILDTSDNRLLRRGIYGGVPLAPLVAAGVPDCMLKYDRDNKGVVRNMFFSLSYSYVTGEAQIMNRGLSTLYIVDALEKKGDVINFVAQEVSRCGDEIINIEIGLKKPSDVMLNIKKCYYPMVGREFLRRILFRVLESMPVQNEWNYGYGRTFDENEIRELYNLNESDLVVSNPIEIGIKGNDIYRDTITLINNLNLNNEFDVDKIKKLVR